MTEYLHTHASLANFLVGYASGMVTAGVFYFLLLERAKRLAVARALWNAGKTDKN